MITTLQKNENTPLFSLYLSSLDINATASTCGVSQHLYYITKVIELLFKIKL